MAVFKRRYSKNYWAVRKRIQRMPKLLEKTVDTITKKDAEGYVKVYKEGIRNNTFGLIPLQPATIKQKKREGYSKPSTPLYAAGDSLKNTYINALRIRKIKKGYRVFISNAKHHKAGLPLSVLFKIHEEGALINTGIAIIRIPPRPTRTKAFYRFIRKRLREENVEIVKKEIINFLLKGTYKDRTKEI